MPRPWSEVLECSSGSLLLIYFHFLSQIMAIERCLWGHEPGDYGFVMIAAVLTAEGLTGHSRIRLVLAGAGRMGWCVVTPGSDRIQLNGQIRADRTWYHWPSPHASQRSAWPRCSPVCSHWESRRAGWPRSSRGSQRENGRREKISGLILKFSKWKYQFWRFELWGEKSVIS